MRCFRRRVRCGVLRPLFTEELEEEGLDTGGAESVVGLMEARLVASVSACMGISRAWAVCGRVCRAGELRMIGGATDMVLVSCVDTRSRGDAGGEPERKSERERDEDGEWERDEDDLAFGGEEEKEKKRGIPRLIREDLPFPLFFLS